MALHQAPWVVGDFWFEYVDVASPVASNG